MPRDVGTGLYRYPDGTPGMPNQTIFSTRYNTFLNDLQVTLNQALPLNMGGTGGTSAATARDNIDAEVSGQVVTDYNTHVFEAGSFTSTPGATGEPVAGKYVSGICHKASADAIVLEAAVFSGTTFTLIGKYTRTKWITWSGWELQASDADDFVEVAGDTMTGTLTLSGVQGTPLLITRNSSDASQKRFRMQAAGKLEIINSTNTTVIASLTDTGLWAVAGTVTAGVNGTTGAYHFGNTGTKYLNFDGTKYDLLGGNPLYIDGNLYVSRAAATITVNAASGVPSLYFGISNAVQSYINDNGGSINVYSNAGGTTGMYIVHGGNAWSAISDARLEYKRNARDITENLPPLDNFRLYENEVPGGSLEVFAKAQEFVELFPHVVIRGDDDPDYVPQPPDPRSWGISYDRIGVIALAYVRQQQQLIAELLARIEALEAKGAN